MITRKIKEMSLKETMEKYPRITAHIIAESLGYATPSCAARILKDAREGNKNYSEWIYSCYTSDPLKAVQNSIKNRHYHKGFICDINWPWILLNELWKQDRSHYSGAGFN